MRLALRCPTCGTGYPTGSRVCPRDGTKLVSVLAPTGAHPQQPPLGARLIKTVSTPNRSSKATGRSSKATGRSTKATGRSSKSPARSSADRSAVPARPALLDLSSVVGQLLDGRYRVAKKIGEGGMSFVYLAEDVSTSERVAIKILSPTLVRDQTALARLRREASVGSKLEHPNVCHIIRLGETSTGLVYIVMPFMDGELLCDRTLRLGHLLLGEVVGFVEGIALGLQVAHDVGIIHRDLKPENVMICAGADGTERAVLMDFGLAKERKVDPSVQKLTATGIVLGTPEFMSPEQLRGKPLDPRSDVYALGLMTFEMLTGKLPFDGKTQQEIMVARLRSEPKLLRKVRPELSFPTAVEGVLSRSIARNPEDRFESAPAFAAALAAAAAGTAAPPTRRSSVISRLFGRSS